MTSHDITGECAVVVGGRFEYMRAAWETAANSKKKILYFDNMPTRSTSFKYRLGNHMLRFMDRLSVSSEEAHIRNNLREYFDIDGLSQNEKILFIFYEFNSISPDRKSIVFLKKRFPNARFVLFFTNIIGSVIDKTRQDFLLQCRDLYDLTYTFERKDAELYGFQLFRDGCFPYDPLPIETDDTYKSDICWIGKDKGRLDVLMRIANKLYDNGFRCKFIVMSDGKKETAYKNGVQVINRPMSYYEVLKYIKNSNCLLDIVPGNCTVTIRWTEAIAYKKKLISNNVGGGVIGCNNGQFCFCTDLTDLGTFEMEFLKKNCVNYINHEMISTKSFINEIVSKLY